MAGVQGRHCVAEPVPLVGTDCGSAWRKEACGKQKLEYTLYKPRWWRTPSSPVQRVLTRRPTAATCWRMVRLRRSTNAVLLCQPHAANTALTRSSVLHI